MDLHIFGITSAPGNRYPLLVVDCAMRFLFAFSPPCMASDAWSSSAEN